MGCMDREGVWVRGACTGRGMHWEGMHGMEEVPARGASPPRGNPPQIPIALIERHLPSEPGT